MLYSRRRELNAIIITTIRGGMHKFEYSDEDIAANRLKKLLSDLNYEQI